MSWYYSGRTGGVCARPLDNTSCLILPRIGEGRRDEVEARCAGRRFDEVDPGDLPPCVGKRVSFMAPFALTRTMTHPYTEIYPETHGHFAPTRFVQPALSAACVQFRWMPREKVKGNAQKGKIGIAERWLPDREPDIRNRGGKEVETVWVQEREKQLALLDTFFGALGPQESLCFFYAKRTPLSGQSRRVIIGVGRVLPVGEATEYAYKAKNPPLRCVLWERNIGHSVPPGFADGFLFPYQEALALAEREGVDPEELVAFAPDEHFDAYSYGSELLAHDGAVASGDPASDDGVERGRRGGRTGQEGERGVECKPRSPSSFNERRDITETLASHALLWPQPVQHPLVEAGQIDLPKLLALVRQPSSHLPVAVQP